MWFFNQKQVFKLNRNFSTPYFKDINIQKEYEVNGYVVLKNIISDTEILQIENFFEQLKKLPSYNVKDIFESSGNFLCRETQKLIFEFVEQFMHKIAERFAILENCDIGDGGTFFIKPTTQTSILHPHQDSTVIDELNSYGLFVWIPLMDINDQNGALCVIPQSHTWGNIHRSQHIPWAFRKQYKFLWNYMLPLYVNKGDIICFDTSIVHGSGINYTNKERVALCGAIFEKNHSKVEYLMKGKEMRKYFVTKDYWLDGGQAENLDNLNSEIIKNEFPNPISKKQIVKLLNC